MIPNEGVEIKDFGLITFDLDQVHEVVEKIGLKFNKNGFLKDGDKDVKCACCDHSIKETNVGNILPGSNIVYCDNPICFVEYMDKHLHL